MNKEILVGMIVFSKHLDDNIEKKLEAEYRSLYKSFCQLIKMVPHHDAKYALDQLLDRHPEFIGKYTVVTMILSEWIRLLVITTEQNTIQYLQTQVHTLMITKKYLRQKTRSLTKFLEYLYGISEDKT